MRFTINTKAQTPAELAKSLRSAAAKLDADAITPGADVTVGNLRIQVADKQVSDIRQFGIDNGFTVGARGRYSAELVGAFAAHQKAERKAAREARAARKAERELAAAV